MSIMDPAAYRDNYIDRLYELQIADYLRQESQLSNMKCSYLPDIVSNSQQQRTDNWTDNSDHKTLSQHHINGGKTTLGVNTYGSDLMVQRSHHKEFRSRIRPAIFRGKTSSIACDPESHLQLQREKQAMSEHRSRPKTPISLQPLHVMSLQRTKGKRLKSQRMTRSAPEILQTRNIDSHRTFYTMPTSDPLTLPKLSTETTMRLNDLVRSKTNIEPAKLPNFTNRGSKTKSAITKHVRPQIQSMKLSQGGAAIRDKQRQQKSVCLSVPDDEQLIKVGVQSYQRKHTDNILELVEQAQYEDTRLVWSATSEQSNSAQYGNRLLHSKAAARRRQPNNTSCHMTSAAGKENEHAGKHSHRQRKGGEKTALVVQLPNITYSRANTPAAAAAPICGLLCNSSLTPTDSTLLEIAPVPCNTRAGTPGSGLLQPTIHRLGDQTYSAILVD